MLLTFSYWNGKNDLMIETDLQALHDFFMADDTKGLTEEIKEDVAITLLQNGFYTHGNIEAYERVLHAVNMFDVNFAVNQLFYTNRQGEINLWRYEYRKLIDEAIPALYTRRAVVKIYKRLGLDLSQEDSTKVMQSSNLYTEYIKFLKEECNGRYIVPQTGDFKEHLSSAAYLNMYFLFGKLGFMGENPYKRFALIGDECPANFIYKPMDKKVAASVEDAKARSRGRDYPTDYEISLVIWLNDINTSK